MHKRKSFYDKNTSSAAMAAPNMPPSENQSGWQTIPGASQPMSPSDSFHSPSTIEVIQRQHSNPSGLGTPISGHQNPQSNSFLPPSSSGFLGTPGASSDFGDHDLDNISERSAVSASGETGGGRGRSASRARRSKTPTRWGVSRHNRLVKQAEKRQRQNRSRSPGARSTRGGAETPLPGMGTEPPGGEALVNLRLHHQQRVFTRKDRSYAADEAFLQVSGDAKVFVDDDPDIPSFQKARPIFKIPFSLWVVAFLGLPIVAVLVYVGCTLLDVHMMNLDLSSTLSISFTTFLEPSASQARSTLSDEFRVSSIVLSMVLTVSAFVVKLAGARISGHVISLIARDRVIMLVVGFFMFANIFILWVAYSTSEVFVPRWGVLLCSIILTGEFALCGPFFAYLAAYTNSENVIQKIVRDGLWAAQRIQEMRRLEHALEVLYVDDLNAGNGLGVNSGHVIFHPLARPEVAKYQDVQAFHRDVRKQQLITLNSVETLGDIGSNSIHRKDDNVIGSCIEAITKLGVSYGDIKPGTQSMWHVLQHWVAVSPDFLSIDAETLRLVQREGVWVEFKILKTMHTLYLEALQAEPEICFLICIQLRLFGEHAMMRADLPAVGLCIKFFNSFLRASINKVDIKNVFNLINQYRELCEFFIILSTLVDPRLTPATRGQYSVDEWRRTISDTALVVTRHLRDYGNIAFTRGGGLFFIAEVVAHDLSAISHLAFQVESSVHREVLQILLRTDSAIVDSVQLKKKESSLIGVRRAHAKLAATYITYGAPGFPFARLIFTEMKDEGVDRLLSIFHELLVLQSNAFWELASRPGCLNYLTQLQKIALQHFFSWFPPFSSTNVDFERLSNIARLHAGPEASFLPPGQNHNLTRADSFASAMGAGPMGMGGVSGSHSGRMAVGGVGTGAGFGRIGSGSVATRNSAAFSSGGGVVGEKDLDTMSIASVDTDDAHSVVGHSKTTSLSGVNKLPRVGSAGATKSGVSDPMRREQLPGRRLMPLSSLPAASGVSSSVGTTPTSTGAPLGSSEAVGGAHTSSGRKPPAPGTATTPPAAMASNSPSPPQSASEPDSDQKQSTGGRTTDQKV